MNLGLDVGSIPLMLVVTMRIRQTELLDALHFSVVEDLISAQHCDKVKHSSVNFGLPRGLIEKPHHNHIGINVVNDQDVEYI